MKKLYRRFYVKSLLRALLAVQAITIGAIGASAAESVYNYKVEFVFMGLKKTAANASVVVNSDGTNFTGTLKGHSIEWGGKIYAVCDTLVATINPSGGSLPVREAVSYKKGWYFKTTESDGASGPYDSSNPAFYRNTDGQGELDASPETMEAVSITADMLAMFNIYGQIPFDTLEQNREYLLSVEMPDGSRQHMILRYFGESKYKINGNEYPSYSTEFEYYYNGRPSGYTVSCEVARDSRVPLVFSSKLMIGHVAMVYEP